MRMHRSALALVLLPALPWSGACDANELETRTYRLEHLQVAQAHMLLEPYVYSDREEAPGMLSVGEGAVTVRETEDNLDKIERVLAEYDVPVPNARLRFQLIEANGASGPPDPQIAAVVEELRRLFRFGGYRLLGEAYMVAGDGGDVEQRFSSIPYHIQADVHRPTRGTIGLSDLRLWQLDGRGVLIRTSVTIPPGQTVVLGSAPMAEGEGSLILTVRAEVADSAAEGG